MITLSEHGISFDAQNDIPDWTKTEFNDDNWAAAVEMGAPPIEPWNNLFLRPIPFWKDSDIRSYENLSDLTFPISGPSEIKGTLPANIQVYPWMSLQAETGREVRIKVERHKFNSIYKTKRGDQSFEVPAWGNGHHVDYFIPEGVKVLELGYRETGYPIDLTGSFSATDEWMNVLWKKAVTTQRLCMRDSFMDCPDRERSSWPGDYANMIELCGYAFGGTADDMIRKSFAELVGWKTKDGILWGAVPTGRFIGSYREIPAQSQAALSIGLRDYWRNSGDISFLEFMYSHVRDYLLKIYHLNPDGSVNHRGPWKKAWGPGTQCWYDWKSEQDLPLMDQTWYACCMLTLSEFAQVLDYPEDKKECLTRWERIKSFISNWWSQEKGGYHSPDYAFLPDSRGNALAVLANLVPQEYFQPITEVLRSRMNNSIYMEKYVIDALFRLKRPDLALERIQQRYGPSLESKYSTLPEHFEEESNHAWGVGPAATLIREVVGLKPDRPGWKIFLIQPADVRTEQCSASINTPHGTISVKIERLPAKWTLEIFCPDGISGRVLLPLKFNTVTSKVSSHSALKVYEYWELPIQTGTNLITATV